MGKTLLVGMVLMVVAARADAQPGMTQPAPPPPVLAPPPAPPPMVAPLPIVDAPEPPERHLICLEGRPFECGSVFLLEAGGRRGTATTWTFDIGLLINSGRYAFGATFGALVYDSPGNRAGEAGEVYKARFRRYLGDDGGAIEIAFGTSPVGVTAEVAIGYRDIIALTAGVQTIDGDPDQELAANAGVRLGAEAIGFLISLIAHAAARR